MRRMPALLAVVLVATLAGSTLAGAQPRRDADKVTGGGQVIASNGNGSLGAGDTLGFVATADGGRISGQFQAVRTSDAGRPTVIYHGRVTCLVVDDNTARFGGNGTDRATGEGFNFTVDVVDNGPESGQGTQGTDVVEFQRADDPCGDGNPLFEETTLARGNLTVHDAA